MKTRMRTLTEGRRRRGRGTGQRYEGQAHNTKFSRNSMYCNVFFCVNRINYTSACLHVLACCRILRRTSLRTPQTSTSSSSAWTIHRGGLLSRLLRFLCTLASSLQDEVGLPKMQRGVVFSLAPYRHCSFQFRRSLRPCKMKYVPRRHIMRLCRVLSQSCPVSCLFLLVALQDEVRPLKAQIDIVFIYLILLDSIVSVSSDLIPFDPAR